MESRNPFTTLVVLAALLLSKIVEAHPCTPCYNDGVPTADPSFQIGEEGAVTCGQLMDSIAGDEEHSNDRCLGNQASMYYLCGCPELPPRRVNPFCSVCPFGNVPEGSKQQVVSTNTGNTRNITCEALDVSLSYATDLSGVNAAEEYCSDTQIQHALSCGCLQLIVPSCLSGDSIVSVQGKGEIPMKYLEIGDKVAASSGDTARYETVYSFGHRDPKATVEYLQLKPSMLEITKNHMLFVVGRGSIPAAMLRVGDTLEASGEVVQEIRTVNRKGAYAPFAPSGRILVNGVMVSTYISFDETIDTLVIGRVNTQLTYQWLAHLFLTPHRLWCYWLGQPDSLLESNGLSNWVAPLESHLSWLFEHCPWLSLIALPIALALLMGLRVLEYSLMCYSHLSWTVVMLLMGTIVSVRKGRKKSCD